jgi:hypothetical protein
MPFPLLVNSSEYLKVGYAVLNLSSLTIDCIPVRENLIEVSVFQVSTFFETIMSLQGLLRRWGRILKSKIFRKKLSRKRGKICLLHLLPLELFLHIANELSFVQKLEMALDTASFGFMFLLPELWSILISNLVI